MVVSNLLEGGHYEPDCEVVCTSLVGPYDPEGKDAGRYLVVGGKYTVVFVDIDMSWTCVELKEFPGVWFYPSLFSGLRYHTYAADVPPEPGNEDSSRMR